jgi:hypothetical protein
MLMEVDGDGSGWWWKRMVDRDGREVDGARSGCY